MPSQNLGFGLKFSDKLDVAGLMQRDEVAENQLRVLVQDYLMEILSLLAFVVNLTGFQRPIIPRMSIPEEEVKSLHMDTKLMNHRQIENGNQSTKALLLSDSLDQEEKPFEEAKDNDLGFQNISTSEIVDEKFILKLLGDSRF